MPEFQTRTLLFSDIEGSTRLQIATGDRYAEILARHRKLIRDAVAAHNGIEHRTAGDGFFFVFASARDAVTAAVQAQRSLDESANEVRVRMGIHAGEVGESDNDVIGLAINEAARIMDAAHGGQILVSPVVRDLTQGALPETVGLRTLGPHRLKDFDEPVELLQVEGAGLESSFPPPRTRDVLVALPVARTSFVGRERERAQVIQLLRTGRHVTLTGVGGAGKTRLAVEASAHEAVRYPDGVFFVDLAPIADPTHVIAAVAASVNVQGDGTDDLDAIVTGYLATRRALIVLDNCEHLVDAAADACDLILGRCPEVSILATSREALQIEGEQTFSVRSLRVDDERSEGVELFVTRARAVQANFEITDENGSHILAVCARLDGIPLAIELAAARVDHMSLTEIAERLDDRFELLVGGRRRRAQRQQTLQAAMDWSWALLDEDERLVLRALAVFAGPFPLDAAAAVTGSIRTLEVVRSLVSKSLVDVVPGETTRYRLLETVRLYAQERLVEAREAAARRDAHRDWYLARAEEVPFDEMTDLRRAKAFIESHPNIRAAADWTLDQDRPDLLARLILSTGSLWTCTIAKAEEGRRWLRLIADDERQPARNRSDAFEQLAASSMVIGDVGAIRTNVDRALELDDSDRPLKASLLWLSGRYDEAIELAQRLGLKGFERLVRAWAAGLRLGVDPAGALEELERVVAETPPDSMNWDIVFGFGGLALARIATGDPAGALPELTELDLTLTEEYEAWFGSLARWYEVIEAVALADLGRFDEARTVLERISRAAIRDNYPLLDNDCLAAFAYLAYRRGQHREAERLLDPVVRVAIPRMAPFGAFVGRFLATLRRELIEANGETTLLRTRDFATRSFAIFSGEAEQDKDAQAQVGRLLRELVGG